MTPDNIKTLRNALQRTQAGMAAIFGVHHLTWARWETGKSTPQPRDQVALMKLYQKYVLTATKDEEVVKP